MLNSEQMQLSQALLLCKSGDFEMVSVRVTLYWVVILSDTRTISVLSHNQWSAVQFHLRLCFKMQKNNVEECSTGKPIGCLGRVLQDVALALLSTDENGLQHF